MKTTVAEAVIRVKTQKLGQAELTLAVETRQMNGSEPKDWLNIKMPFTVHAKTAVVAGKKYLILSPFVASEIFPVLKAGYREDETGTVADSIIIDNRRFTECLVEIIDIEKFDDLEKMVTNDGIRRALFNQNVKLNGGYEVAPEVPRQARRPSHNNEELNEWDDDQNFWSGQNPFFQLKGEKPQFDEFDREKLAE